MWESYSRKIIPQSIPLISRDVIWTDVLLYQQNFTSEAANLLPKQFLKKNLKILKTRNFQPWRSWTWRTACWMYSFTGWPEWIINPSTNFIDFARWPRNFPDTITYQNRKKTIFWKHLQQKYFQCKITKLLILLILCLLWSEKRAQITSRIIAYSKGEMLT